MRKQSPFLETLPPMHAHALFPTTAICEAVTILRGRLNKPDEASGTIKKFQPADFLLQAVDQLAIS
jgi:hypothetical protein